MFKITGSILNVNDHVPWRPLDQTDDKVENNISSKIRHILIARDPAMQELITPFGKVEFRQVSDQFCEWSKSYASENHVSPCQWEFPHSFTFCLKMELKRWLVLDQCMVVLSPMLLWDIDVKKQGQRKRCDLVHGCVLHTTLR